jgi:hypothetical protein
LDFFDVDGLRVSINPNTKASINIAAGMRVPTSYGRAVMSNSKLQGGLVGASDTSTPGITYEHDFFGTPSNAGFALIDGTVSAIPFTTIIAAVALVPAPFMRPTFAFDSIPAVDTINSQLVSRPDSLVWGGAVEQPVDEKSDIRAALGVDISPIPMLRFTGSGRFSVVQKSIDRFDSRLTVLPIQVIEVSAYVLGEKGRVDSTNFFSRLFYEQFYEFGISLNAFPPDVKVCIQGDYHAMSVKDEGVDHFLSFVVAHPNVSGGGGLSLGCHGQTVRAHGGFSLPFLKVFSFEGAGEFYRAWPVVYKEEMLSPSVITMIEKKEDQGPYNAAYLSGGLKLSIAPVGLTVYPRMEYVINRYYSHDFRFLCTMNLILRGFWGGKE